MNQYEAFVGKVLDGRYKILELVGMGGMACVLKAQDLVMKRIVAIKILNDEYNGDEQAEARFIDESKAVAMLSNKNIVSVYDVAIFPDIKYIVMEYLDGITLREYLDNKGVIGWKEACVYILQILRGLEHAHSKGIIHRDIKPQNVMLMKNGDIKVTDFGIAKLPNSVSEQTDEKAIGTVYYISPEQACGKETDYYSDIYSVGIMLYEAVTGTLPFVADSPMEIAMMQVNDEPANPRDIVLDIPVGVSQIILKALEKDPAERFQSAHTMAKAIEWVLRNPGVIFAMSTPESTESPVSSSVVSIDMINTSEIEPYSDVEILENSVKNPKKKKEPKVAPDKKTADKKKKAKKKAKANRTMFPIVCGVAIPFFIVVIVLMVTIGISWITSFMNGPEEEEILIPDYVGKYFDSDIETEIHNKFNLVKEYETRDDFDDNVVVRTDPEPGQWKKLEDKETKITLTVYINKSEKVTIPELAGFSKRVAENRLNKLSLDIEVIEVSNTKELYQEGGNIGDNNAYIQGDTIIKTIPAPGTTVQKGSRVKVYVLSKSKSDKTAKMPNLVGLSPTEAIAVAEAAGYSLEAPVYKYYPNGNDKIVEQSVVPGTVMNKDENKVSIVVGMKPEEMIDLCGQDGLNFYTLTQAKQILASAYPDFSFNVSASYLVTDDINRETVETISQEAKGKDIIEITKQLMDDADCQMDLTLSTGHIIFQDIAAGAELIPTEGSMGEQIIDLKLIIIRYRTSDPNGGDTSGGFPWI